MANDDTIAETTPRAERYCPSCDRSFHSELERCPDDGTRLVRIHELPDPFIGRTLDGRFEIRERIGAGGMGTVYRAWQHSIGREVAIKIIDARHVHDTMAIRRFLREARLASQLSQPNTVSVLDFGQTEDGHLYLAMELLKGRTLAAVVEQEGAFDARRVVRIGIQLCDALDAAHGLSIVHRDLKPANILVLDDPPGRDLIKVLDFGLAKSLEVDESESTLSGRIVGTPRYMSPEAALGEDAGPLSDLYSLGVILHEAATGRPMFSAPTASGILAQKVARPAVDASIPEPLRGLLGALLAPDALLRPSSAAAVRETLERCRATLPSSAESRPIPARAATPPPTEVLAPATPPPTVAPAPRRRALRWGVPALLVAALAAAAIYLVGSEHDDDAAIAEAPPPVPTAAGNALTGDAAPPTTTVDDAPTTPPRADAAPASVELSLRSTPRASVSVDGREVGRTPITLEVPAGSEPLDVVFSRDGRKSVRRTVVPDRAHAIDVALPVKAKKKPRKRPKPDYPF